MHQSRASLPVLNWTGWISGPLTTKWPCWYRESARSGADPRAVFGPQVINTTWSFYMNYFVSIRRGGDDAPGAAGEITNVAQAFQPSGRFSAANSL
jgi:hypothetical protein